MNVKDIHRGQLTQVPTRQYVADGILPFTEEEEENSLDDHRNHNQQPGGYVQHPLLGHLDRLLSTATVPSIPPMLFRLNVQIPGGGKPVHSPFG